METSMIALDTTRRLHARGLPSRPAGLCGCLYQRTHCWSNALINGDGELSPAEQARAIGRSDRDGMVDQPR